MSGFIEVQVRRSRVGRPARRRWSRIRLRSGDAIEFGDGVPLSLIRSLVLLLGRGWRT